MIYNAKRDIIDLSRGSGSHLLDSSRCLALNARVGPKFLENTVRQTYRMAEGWEFDAKGLVPGECLVPVREVVNSHGDESFGLLVVAYLRDQ